MPRINIVDAGIYFPAREARRAMNQEAFDIFPWADFACPCCGMVGVSSRLIDAYYELTRRIYENRIVLHSGYRCEAHNRAVGGSPRSRHTFGQAMDFHIMDLSLRDMYEVVCCVPLFKGIGAYREWNNPGLHCDVRQQRIRWEQVNGIYRKGIKWSG